jgi:hypothetical protein
LPVGAVAPIAASRESAAVPLRRLILSSHISCYRSYEAAIFYSSSHGKVTVAELCDREPSLLVAVRHCGAKQPALQSRGATARRRDERHVRFLAPIAYLSPRIIQAIAEGRAPADMAVTQLTRNLPLPWTEPEEQLGLG